MPSSLRDCPLPAPNFGKTAGVLKIPIEAAGYEDAKGFSEIGRRGKRLIPAVWLALSKQMRSKGTGMDGWGMLLLRLMS